MEQTASVPASVHYSGFILVTSRCRNTFVCYGPFVSICYGLNKLYAVFSVTITLETEIDTLALRAWDVYIGFRDDLTSVVTSNPAYNLYLVST